MKAAGINYIVKPLYTEKTEGGLYIPQTAQNGADDVQEGIVVSVGDGTYIGGKVEMSYKEGERVFYRASKGMKISKDGEEYKILPVSDILFSDETV